MAKFRMVAQTRDGVHVSSPLGLVDAVRATAMTRQMLHSNSVELLPDTRSLRGMLAVVQAMPCPHGSVVFPVAWSQPLKIYAVDGCQCESCVMIRAVGKKDQEKPPLQQGYLSNDEEHPEFAFPKVDHCGLLVEEEETPAVKMSVVHELAVPRAESRRRKSLAEQRREAWRMFGSSCRQWSWRWPLIIPPTLVLLMLASCLSLALETFAWFVAKEPGL